MDRSSEKQSLRRWTSPQSAAAVAAAGAAAGQESARDSVSWSRFAAIERVEALAALPQYVRLYAGSGKREAGIKDLPAQRRAQAAALLQATGNAVVVLSEPVFAPDVALDWARALRADGHAIDLWMRAPAEVLEALYAQELRRQTIRHDIQQATQQAPNELHALLAEAIRRGASDIDIEVDEGRRATRIRLKIAGQFVVREERADTFGTDLVRAAFDAVPLDERTRNKTPWSPRADLSGLAVFPAAHDARVRLQQMVSVGGFGCALRIVDYDGLFRRYESLADLGFSADQADAIVRALGRTRGIVLFVGGTGSGKTTALSVAVSRSPRFAQRKWVSIEDPPEIRTPGIFAHPVYGAGAFGGPTQADGFIEALRNVLRFTPDGVLAGEIRDPASATLALALASSGHVAAATLHAADPFVALKHLSGQTLRLDPVALSEPGVLSLVVAMHLVPRLCPQCSQPADPLDPAVQRTAGLLSDHGLAATGLRRRHPEGCPHCNAGLPGYSGRRACASVVAFDREMSLALGREGSEGVYRLWRSRRSPTAPPQDLSGRTVEEHMLLRVAAGECDPADFDRMFGP